MVICHQDPKKMKALCQRS